MKALIPTLLASFVVAMLAGCSSDQPTEAEVKQAWEQANQTAQAETRVVVVEVGGRKIPCVIWDSYKAGGISCDWSVK